MFLFISVTMYFPYLDFGIKKAPLNEWHHNGKPGC
jgi:hypothetical protein